MRALLLLILAGSLAGCASYFKRKECEKTNWYQHGYNVAMAGKRLDADDFVKQCQKVEAEFSWTELDTGFKAGMGKYCTDDNVFAVGKAGKPFAYEMCDGQSEKRMRARYVEGNRLFCTPSNGYRFGASGGIYENVCKDNEDSWLAQYRKGRKVYLQAVIVEKEKEANRLGSELASLERRQSQLNLRHAALTRKKSVRHERIYDPATRTYREVEVRGEQDDETKRKSQQVETELSNVNYQLERTRKQHTELHGELSKLRTELATL